MELSFTTSAPLNNPETIRVDLELPQTYTRIFGDSWINSSPYRNCGADILLLFCPTEQWMPENCVHFKDTELTERPRFDRQRTESTVSLRSAMNGSTKSIPRVTDEYVAAMLRPRYDN